MKKILLLVVIFSSFILNACGGAGLTNVSEKTPTELPGKTQFIKQTTQNTLQEPTNNIFFNLDIVTNPSDAGMVTPTSGDYEKGKSITLKAFSSKGYIFDTWSGDVSGSVENISITMDSDKKVIANFKKIEYTLTVKVTGKGNTIPQDVDSFIAGAIVELYAIPDIGWEFNGWSGDIKNTSSSIKITMDSNKTITANFLENNLSKPTNTTPSTSYIPPSTVSELTPTSTDAGTRVGGIISSNTTWTKVNSPYVITNTVQIPEGVTLTIEPGVTVIKLSSSSMFLLLGKISALGTINDKITFDADVSLGGPGNASLDYCVFKKGFSFGGRGGYINLAHSEINNGLSISLESPSGDCYIEYNRFKNKGGISVYQASGFKCKIYVRYNLFHGPAFRFSNEGGSPGISEMVVRYNTFIGVVGTDGIILSLRPIFDSSNMDATENYWDTMDKNIIDQKIYDKNDDIRVKNYINYLPMLIEPNPNTPIP